MEKVEHGLKLKAAMSRAGMGRKDVSLATGRGVRTVTDWTSGTTWPDPIDRENLRKLFPGYDNPGDPIEVAVMSSTVLTEDRRFELVAYYKRLLREQAADGSATG